MVSMSWQFNILCWRLPWHRKSLDRDYGLFSNFAGVGPFQFHWWSKGMQQERKYLGDGVYASVDSLNQIWVRTERDRGIEAVAFEPQTFRNLIDFARACWPPELQRAVGIYVPTPSGGDREPERKEGGT